MRKDATQQLVSGYQFSMLHTERRLRVAVGPKISWASCRGEQHASAKFPGNALSTLRVPTEIDKAIPEGDACETRFTVRHRLSGHLQLRSAHTDIRVLPHTFWIFADHHLCRQIWFSGTHRHLTFQLGCSRATPGCDVSSTKKFFSQDDDASVEAPCPRFGSLRMVGRVRNDTPRKCISSRKIYHRAIRGIQSGKQFTRSAYFCAS